MESIKRQGSIFPILLGVDTLVGDKMTRIYLYSCINESNYFLFIWI